MNTKGVRFLFTIIFSMLITFSCASFPHSEFEGTWFMNSGPNSADITIANTTEKSFEFLFEGIYPNEITGSANMGDLEGTAFFTAGNKAVCVYSSEYLDDVTFEFAINGGKLLVSVVEGSEFGLFGLGVYMCGEYSK